MNPLENVMKNAFNELRYGFGTSFIKQNFILKRQRKRLFSNSADEFIITVIYHSYCTFALFQYYV